MAKISWRDIANAAIDLKAEDFLRGGVTVGAVLLGSLGTFGGIVWAVSNKTTQITAKQDEQSKQIAELIETSKTQTASAQQVRDRIVWIEARCCESARPATRNTFGYTPTTTVNVRTNTAGTP